MRSLRATVAIYLAVGLPFSGLGAYFMEGQFSPYVQSWHSDLPPNNYTGLRVWACEGESLEASLSEDTGQRLRAVLEYVPGEKETELDFPNATILHEVNASSGQFVHPVSRTGYHFLFVANLNENWSNFSWSLTRSGACYLIALPAAMLVAFAPILAVVGWRRWKRDPVVPRVVDEEDEGGAADDERSEGAPEGPNPDRRAPGKPP